jgi:4-amino-4-deoxychorismate lyase
MRSSLCIETICVENRKIVREAYHNTRLNKTRNDLFDGQEPWTLSKIIDIPDHVTDARHKLRIVYGNELEQVSWELHTRRTIRSIKKVYDDQIDYAYKYEDRQALTALFNMRGDADEILIIKNEMVSDCFFYNVAFGDGDTWYTPHTHLLAGTQKAFLLDSGVISEASISEKDISRFPYIKLFNALTDWADAPTIRTAEMM